MMRKAGSQPRILLTNVKQLELLLTRQKDVELFGAARRFLPLRMPVILVVILQIHIKSLARFKLESQSIGAMILKARPARIRSNPSGVPIRFPQETFFSIAMIVPNTIIHRK